MGECKETRKFCRALEAQGAATYPAVASKYSPPGWPDRSVQHPMWGGWLEFKAWDGRVKPEQVTQIRRIKAAAGQAYVARFSADWTELRLEDEEGTVLTEFFRWGQFFTQVGVVAHASLQRDQ